MKTHWKQIDPSAKYLGSWDCAEPLQLTIKSVTTDRVANAQGKTDEVMVITFTKGKPMIANKTNLKAIERLYGPYIEDWTGKSITLVAEQVRAFGEVTEAIRVSNKVDLLPTLIDLYETKQSQIDADTKTKIEAIIQNRIEGSYLKSVKYLTNL